MEENKRIFYVEDKEESLSVRVYNVGYEKCNSSHKWGPGIRDFFLMHYIVSGKGRYYVDDKVYELSAGNTFIIYPYTKITYCADESEPWEYYWVGFQGTDAKIILNKTDFTEENHVIYLEDGNEFKDLFIKIYQEKGNEEHNKIKMTGYLFLLLSLYIEKSKHNTKFKNIAEEYSKKAAEFISYNYVQNITVEEVADYIGISRSHLYRVFMMSFQKSPIQYILEYRIGQACELLKASSLSVGAIGFSVGFEDNLYFSRAFRKIMKMSPKEYRNKHKAEQKNN